MGFTSPKPNRTCAGHLVWAHRLGSHCTGGNSRDPIRRVIILTRLGLFPCPVRWLGLRWSFIFLPWLQKQFVALPLIWTFNFKKLNIPWNEPHPLLMASCSPFFAKDWSICHTRSGFLWPWQKCTWESAEGQYYMDTWFTDPSFTSQKTLITCMFWYGYILCRHLSVLSLALYVLFATCHSYFPANMGTWCQWNVFMD